MWAAALAVPAAALTLAALCCYAGAPQAFPNQPPSHLCAYIMHWSSTAGLGPLLSCARPSHDWRLCSPSAHPPWLLLTSRRIAPLTWRAVRRCHPGTAPVDVSCAHTWARPACRVLMLALKAAPKAPVNSPTRSSAGRATPSNRIDALPFSVYRARVVVAWKDGVVPYRSL